MKILIWETSEPRDRIILCIIAIIPVYLLGRGIWRYNHSYDKEHGYVYPIGYLYPGYTTYPLAITLDVCYWLIMALMVVVFISIIQIAWKWFKSNNSRDVI